MLTKGWAVSVLLITHICMNTEMQSKEWLEIQRYFNTGDNCTDINPEKCQKKTFSRAATCENRGQEKSD